MSDSHSVKQQPARLVEAIGTFFLAFSIGMAALEPNSAGQFTPIAFVSVLVAMIYAGGHISGAHYNPAATFTFIFRRRFPVKEAVPYIITQCCAAAAAGFVTLIMKDTGAEPLVVDALEVDWMRMGLSEFTFTYALCFVILLVATTKQTEGNQYYGIAIGLVVLGGAYAVGAISAAAFNPAVTISLVVMGILDPIVLPMYIAVQIAAAYAAAATVNAVAAD